MNLAANNTFHGGSQRDRGIKMIEDFGVEGAVAGLRGIDS